MIDQTKSDNELDEFIQEALHAAKRLYHCNATNCPCGDGKAAIEKTPEFLQFVTGAETAKAYIDGIVGASSTLGKILVLASEGAREFMALLICEAARKGGLLTEAQIQAAIDAQAIREAEAEEKSSKPANPPKPAQIPNPLAFVPGPKSIREN